MTNPELINHLQNQIKELNQNPEVAFFIFFYYHPTIKNKLDFINHRLDICDPNVENQCELALHEYLINNKPLAKILGETRFYSYDFQVYPQVFSPRNETELLVDCVIHKCQHRGELKAADICCGTGVIGLSVLKSLNNITDMYMVDLNPNAIDNTVRNASNLQLHPHVHLGDLLNPLINNKIRVDILISNPPYISRNEVLDLNVDKYDPELALYAEDDGLAVYQNLLENARKVINPSSYLIALEIGYLQAKSVSELAYKYLGNQIKIEVIQDYNHLDRIVLISYGF